MAINVWFGTGENAALSNLASRPFTVNGHYYFSVEHAYQTLKSGTFDEVTFRKYHSAGVKIIGRFKANTRDGWNVGLMGKLIRLSFLRNPLRADLLVKTGNAVITHTQDRGIWRTEFPRILMEVRDELRANVKESCNGHV